MRQISHVSWLPFSRHLLAFLLFVACQRPASTLILHTAMGEMTVQVRPGLSDALSVALDQLAASNPDSLTINKVLHDGFVQLNFQVPELSRQNEPLQLPTSGTFVVCGNNFYLVQGRSHNDASLDKWERTSGQKLSPQAREQYKQKGGALQLDGCCQVLGQLVAGKEVLDRIAALPNDAKGRPLRPVPLRLEHKK